MSAAFTPGPWGYKEFVTEKGAVFYITQVDGDIGQIDVAYTYSHKGNARLIAAAPCMLSELIYLRDCIETGKQPAMGRINALIAKAEGLAV